MPPARKKRRPVSKPSPAEFKNALTNSNFIRWGLYGDSGIGKTRFIATLTSGRILLVRSPIDFVDSILTAGLGSNIEQRIISTWEEMWDLRDELRSEGKKYDWVWYDSWPGLQETLMDDVWGAALDRNPDRRKFGLDKQEHGINQHRMGENMREVIGINAFNFGWTAHTQTAITPDLDEDGDPVEKLMPNIHGGQGTLAVKFCGMTTLVTILAKNSKGVRVLHTESSPIYYAKNQYSDEGEDWAIKSPTVPKVLELIEAGQTATKPRPGRGSRRRPTSTRKKGR